MRWISGWRHGARRLRKNTAGSTAIEFAMVIGPFLGLMFAIIEVALAYFVQFSMESGNEAALRAIRTGDVQKKGMTQAQYKARVCSKLPGFMKCNEKLVVDIRSFKSFREAASNIPNLFDSTGARTSNPEMFCPGSENAVVVGTLYYKWTFIAGMPGLGDFTGKMGLSLANSPDGSRLIMVGFATKNEPFGAAPATPGC